MCLSPVEIRNPYFNKKMFYTSLGRKLHKGEVDALKPTSPFLTVPCRHCEECLKSSSNAILIRAHFESMTSYVYNIMLSYDNSHIPTITLSSSTGEDVRLVYPEYSHIQNMFKRLRNDPDFQNRDFRYVVASEYGSENRRPHWHILLFIARKFSDSQQTPLRLQRVLKERLIRFYSNNIGTRKNPVYDPLLTAAEKIVNGKTYTNYLVRYIDTNERQNACNSTMPITALTSYLIKYAMKEDAEFLAYKKDLLSKLSSESHLTEELIRVITPVFKYSKNFGLGFSDSGYKLSFPPFYFTKSYTQDTFISNSFYKEAEDFYNSLITSSKHNYILSVFYDKVKNKLINTVEQIPVFFIPFYAELFQYALCTSRSFRRTIHQLNDSFVFPPKKTIFPILKNSLSAEASDQYKRIMQSPVYKAVRNAIENSINNTNSNFLQITFTTSEKTFTFALPSYYKERFYTIEDRYKFLEKRGLTNVSELTPDRRDAITLTHRQAQLMRDKIRKINDCNIKNMNNPFKRDRKSLPYSTSFSEYDAIFIPPAVEDVLQANIDYRYYNRLF